MAAIKMPIPPEVLFHRFFQTLPRPLRERYKGKKDLALLPQPEVRALLGGVQDGYNQALYDEKRNVPEHVEHPPFHFDYIDSTYPNALAFRYEGFSFVGVTFALVEVLWDVCLRLSRSDSVATAVGVCLAPEKRERFHVVLMQTQLNFVVSHEYTHHVHGHVLRGLGSSFISEVLDECAAGCLQQQVLEADADGYATYHVLANLIGGDARVGALSLLGLDAEPPVLQDQALLSCFVVAVGAYFFVRPPQTVNRENIYRLTHPPQAARMNCLMHRAMVWCQQNRPTLREWMTVERFQLLMSGVVDATWGLNGGKDWVEQDAFFRSEEGARYIRKLDEDLKAYILSL